MSSPPAQRPKPTILFGTLLRHHRLASGFSQEFLAERAGVSVNALWAWESGTRKAPYRANVTALVRALNLSDAEALELQAAADRARARVRTPKPAGPNDEADAVRLPTLRTSFFGRSDDLRRLQDLLVSEHSPIVTISGPGGVGKTRLAIEAARNVAVRFPDGVYFVDLANVEDPDNVASAVSMALGVAESDGQTLAQSLGRRCRSRHFLLLLDNCEHVLSAVCSLIQTVFAEHAGLTVLATSREATRLANERLYILEPLAYPTEPIPIEAADRYPALQMFVNRAATVMTNGFVLSRDNIAAVSDVVRRLDGLPLAIELAIPMLRIMSVEQLAANLADRFGLLTAGRTDAPGRHHALRNVVAWSYDSLSEGERFVFESCSIFRDSFDADAVVAVCAREDFGRSRILTILLRLVEKSLVVAVAFSPGRYRLLETLREYAQAKARSTGVDVALALMPRVAAHFLHVAKQTLMLTGTISHHERYRRLRPDLANFELVVTWALSEEHDPVLGANFIVAIRETIYIFFGSRSRAWFIRAKRLLDAETHATLFAEVVLGLEILSENVADVEERLTDLERAIEISRTHFLVSVQLRCLIYYGFNLISIGAYDRAQQSGVEAIRLARETGSVAPLAWALRSSAALLLDREPARQRELIAEAIHLLQGDEINRTNFANTLCKSGEAEYFSGNIDIALRQTSEACEIRTAIGEARGLDWAVLLCNLATMSSTLNDPEGSRAAGRRALQACLDAHEDPLALFMILQIAYTSALLGEIRTATALAGYCERWLPTTVRPQFRVHQHLRPRLRELIAVEMGDERQGVLNAGARLSHEEALDIAFGR